MQRQGSLTDEDHVKSATEFDPALPNNLVILEPVSLVFDPDSTQQGFAAASYCVFSFQLPGFDRPPSVITSWNKVNSDNAYIGLADWEKGRWKWFAGHNVSSNQIGSMDSFIRADGLVLVAFVYLGEEIARLLDVRIGGLGPQAQISLTPFGGFAPAEVVADGSLSRDSDGTIISYEWDLDDDGNFEVQNTQPALPGISFPTRARMPIALRVTDNDLQTDIDERIIAVDEGWAHSLGGTNLDQLINITHDTSGNLYAIGSTTSFGGGIGELWLVSLDQAGNLLWTRTWGSVEEEAGKDLAIDSTGAIVVLGSGGSTSTEAFLLKWSSDGNLLASKRMLSTGGMFPTALSLFEDRALVVGNRFQGGEERPFLFSYDLESGDFWIRQWDLGGGSSQNFNDVEAVAGIFPGLERFYCVGEANDRAVLVECDDEGNDIIAQNLDTTSSSAATDLNISGILGVDKHVAGFVTSGSVRTAFVSRWDLQEHDSFTWVVDENITTTTSYAVNTLGTHITCGTGSTDGSWIQSFNSTGQPLHQLLLNKHTGRLSMNGLTLISDDVAAFCGFADLAEGLEMEGADVQFDMQSISWETITISDAAMDAPQIGDFVGIIRFPNLLVDLPPIPGDFGDGFIMVNSLSTE